LGSRAQQLLVFSFLISWCVRWEGNEEQIEEIKAIEQIKEIKAIEQIEPS